MTMFARSRRPAGRLVAAAAAVSLAALPILSAQAQVVGINAAIRNSVQIRGAGTQQVRPAVLRQRVGLNDEVRTGNGSQLQILLLDRSVFTVGANARLTVDRFVYDPQRSVRSVGATVTRGAFRFMSGRSLGLGSSNRSIRTPVATIGIRGTIVDGVVGGDAIAIAAGEPAVGRRVGGDESSASLIILRGPGPNAQGGAGRGVIDIDTDNRDVTMDRPGLAVYIPRPGAAPIGPFLISRAGLIRVQQLLSPPLSILPSLAVAPAVEFGEPPVDPGDGGRAELADGGRDQGPADAPLPVDPTGDRHKTWIFVGLAAAAVVLIAVLANGGGNGGGDGGTMRPQSP